MGAVGGVAHMRVVLGKERPAAVAVHPEDIGSGFALQDFNPVCPADLEAAVFAAAAPDEPRMERAAAARMPFTAFFDMLFMSLTSPEAWCRHGAGGSGRDSPRGSRGATEARSLNDTPLMIFYQTWRISSVKGGRFSPCHGEAPSLCLPGACSRQQHPPSQHAECMKEAECGIAVKKSVLDEVQCHKVPSPAPALSPPPP